MELFKPENQWIRYFEIESKLQSARASSTTSPNASKLHDFGHAWTNLCHYYGIPIDEFPIIIYNWTWASWRKYTHKYTPLPAKHNGHRRSRNFTALKCTISDWFGMDTHVVNSSDWVSLSSFLSQSFSHHFTARLFSIDYWLSALLNKHMNKTKAATMISMFSELIEEMEKRQRKKLASDIWCAHTAHAVLLWMWIVMIWSSSKLNVKSK